MIDKILEKIPKYNLFNYLFPGVLFIVFAHKTNNLDLMGLSGVSSIVVLLFFAYFIGMIISRIGSLLVEPFLKKIGFVRFAKYSDYLEAIKIDENIKTLSEENNVYRTFISVFVGLGLLQLFNFLTVHFSLSKIEVNLIVTFLFISLFSFSYRKQTNYVRIRINKFLKK